MPFDNWTPRPWRLVHAIHPVLFGCMYAAFSLSYHLAGGTNYHFEPFVYHITDWARTWRTLGVMLGVFVALVTFHAMFCLLGRLREVCRGRRRRARGGEGAGH